MKVRVTLSMDQDRIEKLMADNYSDTTPEERRFCELAILRDYGQPEGAVEHE